MGGEGGKTTPGMQAGEAPAGEKTQATQLALGGMQQGMAMSLREGRNFTAIPSDNPRFVDASGARSWPENVNRWTIPGAVVYRNALANGASEAEAMSRGQQAVGQGAGTGSRRRSRTPTSA